MTSTEALQRRSVAQKLVQLQRKVFDRGGFSRNKVTNFVVFQTFGDQFFALLTKLFEQLAVALGQLVTLDLTVIELCVDVIEFLNDRNAT